MQTPVRGKSKKINSILTGGLCLNVLGFSAGCQKGSKAREQLGHVQNVCTEFLWTRHFTIMGTEQRTLSCLYILHPTHVHINR